MALSSLVPALTTTFTPSPSCLIDYFKLPYQGSALTCLDAQNSSSQCFFTHLGPATSTSDCLPSGYVPTSSFFYSPGLCPSGYELACHSTAGTETRGTCCPSSFQCQTESGWPWYSTDLCTIAIPATVSVVYQVSSVGVGWVTSTGMGAAANAFGIPVRWQSSYLTPATSTLATAASNTALSLSTSEPPAGPTSSSTSGLSSGAIAGIAVGSAAGMSAVVAAIVYWVFRSRQRQRQRIAADASTRQWTKPEESFYSAEHRYSPASSPHSQEVKQPNSRSELPDHGVQRIHELQ